MDYEAVMFNIRTKENKLFEFVFLVKTIVISNPISLVTYLK